MIRKSAGQRKAIKVLKMVKEVVSRELSLRNLTTICTETMNWVLNSDFASNPMITNSITNQPPK